LFIENKLLYTQPLLCVEAGRVDDFYVRAKESRYPTLHLSLADFEAPHLALVTYGGNTPQALEMAKRLLVEHEIVADIVLPSLLSPLPLEEIDTAVADAPLIVTLEEGPKTAGWGAEVVAALSEMRPRSPRRFLRFGAANCPIPSAKPLEELMLPAIENMMPTICRML
jgi:2-oxoisovalerate dehydrogenase E1 component